MRGPIQYLEIRHHYSFRLQPTTFPSIPLILFVYERHSYISALQKKVLKQLQIFHRQLTPCCINNQHLINPYFHPWDIFTSLPRKTRAIKRLYMLVSRIKGQFLLVALMSFHYRFSHFFAFVPYLHMQTFCLDVIHCHDIIVITHFAFLECFSAHIMNVGTE